MKRTTNTAMADAMKAAAAKMPAAKAAAKTEQAPLVTLKAGDWLKGSLLTAMRAKYGTDVEAGQRGADWLVETGRVKVQAGCTLKCVGVARFGGALAFPCDDGVTYARKPKAVIAGLPD
jgi:hypothetical protein